MNNMNHLHNLFVDRVDIIDFIVILNTLLINNMLSLIKSNKITKLQNK